MRTFNRRFLAAVSAVALGLALVPDAAAVESGNDPKTPFESFGAFLNRVSGARFQGQGVVQGEQAFGEMRSHILKLYQGVEVKSSFVDSDSYFDCVVTETQPSVRALRGAPIATPPAQPDGSAVPAGSQVATQYAPGQVDVFGNAMVCPAGTIPMRRLSLERMTTFPTLKAYLAKKPGNTGASTTGVAGYAQGYQFVNNHGTSSMLNLWDPAGWFSLSQQWVIAPGQTAEGGWIHYHNRFGLVPSVLFIFFTADSYFTGCYNLECQAFVQITNAYTLGARWANYGTYGGPQYEFAEQWKYFQGNWWLFINNTAVGYYPGSVYGSGPMALGNATETNFGGETVNPLSSAGSWPQMGSGLSASNGFGYAAYQRNIFYIDRANISHWSALTPSATRPNCYTINITDSSVGGSWGTYHYFGGPGGPTALC